MYGRIAAASKYIPVFYEDTSFTKAHRKDSIRNLSEIRIKSVLLTSSQKLDSLKERNEERGKFKKKLKRLESMIEAKFKGLVIMDDAAKVIQRAYKSHVSRRSFDIDHVQKRKKSIEDHIEYHRKLIFNTNFHVGNVPNLAALKLQTAFRRFLFGKKIERIRVTYEIILKERVFKFYSIVRKVSYSYLAKQTAKWKALKAERPGRLKKIRENLALIYINLYLSLIHI